MIKFFAIIFFLAINPLVMAEDLLIEIQKNLVDSQTIRGGFNQVKNIDGVAKPLKSQGYFIVDKTKGVVWVTEKPFFGVLRVTRNEILQRTESQVLMKISSDSEPVVRSVNEVLFALFSNEIGTLNKYFSYSGEVDKGRWIIRLKPNAGGMSKLIKSITMEGRNYVDKVILEMETKDTIQINFTSQKILKALSDNENELFK